ncbi:MAG: hypothetical protein ACE15C_06550 [Phycisphaerae bacterium]
MKTIKRVVVVAAGCAAVVGLMCIALLAGGCGTAGGCPHHAMMASGGFGASCHGSGAPAAAPAGPNVSAGIVNSRCPIMGGAVDPLSTPDSLTRTYKGQKVAFCCGGCPGRWDALADADKEAKLAKVAAR